MNKKYVSKILAGILAVNMIVTSSALTFAADNDSKDAYLNYQNETAYMNENYHATGYRELDGEYQIIPDVLNDNYSYIDGTEITKAAAYPSTYKTANLPDVRDQGSYGVCWAFSTISLIETNLIKKNLVSNDIDLSELHLVNYTYNCVNDPLGGLEGDINKFDTSYGSVMQYGGNVEMAANSLLDWEGAVNEDVVPYTTEYVRQVENNQLDDSLAYGKDVAHVQNFYRVNTTSKEDVKKAVMDYGAVSISYWSDQSSDWSTQYYNSLTAAYYCPEGYTTNHAVNIVGWDDDYSSDNFATKPEGNGAWIVRNSWGSEYGKDGYFYLSYYDKSIYSVGYTLEAELSDNYNNNYQYDGAMLYGYMGYTGSNKYSNIFEAKANLGGSENIKAVSFMTGSSTNLNYTVSVYTNLSDDTNPESGTLAAQKSGVTTYDGMYTVVLDSSVNINEGKKFSVVVEVNSNSGKTAYLAYERSMQSGKAGYWCTASVKANQSFINSPYNGWNDFSNKSYGGNFIIKAFTDNETTTVDVEKVSLNKSATTLTEGESETLTATITPSNATGDKTVKWSSSNEAVATVDSNGKVTAKKAGTAVITATSSNGKTAGCTVTVKQKDTYTGLRDVNGTLTYFNNGQADKTYTGFVSYAGNNYYVINGVVDTSYTNVTYDGKDWLYVENGKVRYDYTGIRPNENGWWRIENGKVNFDYTGVAENENGWWRIEGGKVNFDYNGIAENENGWWKIEGGKVNFDYTGVAENENGWWRIEGGKVNFDYYGVVENENGWWKIEGGKVNFDYTGIANNENGWWRIEGGKVNFDFTGVASNENGEFYIENGKVDFSKNGLYVYNGIRYNIVNGWAYRI